MLDCVNPALLLVILGVSMLERDFGEGVGSLLSGTCFRGDVGCGGNGFWDLLGEGGGVARFIRLAALS